MLETRRLNEAEIPQALSLLHRLYVEQFGWNPPVTNPSKLRVEQASDGRKILTDDFVTNSRWFGLFQEDELVGCIRSLTQVGGQLEVERYTDVKERNEYSNAREINRMALPESLFLGPAPILLIKAVAEDCARDNVDAIFTALPEPGPVDLCLKLGFKKLRNESFKYHETDPGPVWLLGLDNRSGSSIEKVVAICDEILS